MKITNPKVQQPQLTQFENILQEEISISGDAIALKSIPDWNGHPIQIVKSRGGVIATVVPEENLVRTGIAMAPCWPA